MVYKTDTTLRQTKEFDAQIQVLDIRNEIKVGYSPIWFVRCGRSAWRIAKLKWKMGKETRGKKMEDPHLPQVQRDGPMQLPATAAACVRQFQELRGSLPCCLHGWQRMCHVGQSHLLREEGRCRWCWRQEEVSACRFLSPPR